MQFSTFLLLAMSGLGLGRVISRDASEVENRSSSLSTKEASESSLHQLHARVKIDSNGSIRPDQTMKLREGAEIKVKSVSFAYTTPPPDYEGPIFRSLQGLAFDFTRHWPSAEGSVQDHNDGGPTLTLKWSLPASEIFPQFQEGEIFAILSATYLAMTDRHSGYAILKIDTGHRGELSMQLAVQ
ncbi:hypothetical protein F4778DRAFT_741951 [Xylariomycetidae sp. FL2044]|nr:hypothetical protein F4778DRAFT_741951 [Xylariomycetidae sp. FL2044]